MVLKGTIMVPKGPLWSCGEGVVRVLTTMNLVEAREARLAGQHEAIPPRKDLSHILCDFGNHTDNSCQ